MVFLFPFCVRKVKRSLFGVQGKRRLSLASSQGFESFHFLSTQGFHCSEFILLVFTQDFPPLDIKDFRGIFVLE